MAKDRDTPLARKIRALLKEKGLTPKKASLDAGLGETYVRDLIVEGRSGGPQVKKLRQLARFLGVPEQTLLALAAAPDAAELVEDEQELVLLRAFRELADAGQQDVLDYIMFQIARRARATTGEAV